MKKHSLMLSATALSLGLSTTTYAAADVTWVRSNGADQGIFCTRAVPCRTLQFAHDQTNPGGTIITMDDEDYGPINITKSITIKAASKVALIRTSAIYPIQINAGNTDKVVLEGLTLDGVNRNFAGVIVNSAASVYLIDSTVKNTFIALYNVSTTPGSRAFIQRSNLLGNTYGADVNGTGRVISVLDSLIDGSLTAAIYADAGIVGVARTVVNAGPTAIQTFNGGQAISIGPSNVVSGAGSFNATVPFN